MKSTIFTTLVLGGLAAVAGAFMKFSYLPAGNYVLLGGLFLVLIGGALTLLQVSTPDDRPNAD